MDEKLSEKDKKELYEIREAQFKEVVDSVMEKGEETKTEIYNAIKDLPQDLIDDPEKDKERKMILKMLKNIVLSNEKIVDNVSKIVIRGAEQEIGKGL
jgi:uncharacterized tellurite resistance protein B-like protein